MGCLIITVGSIVRSVMYVPKSSYTIKKTNILVFFLNIVSTFSLIFLEVTFFYTVMLVSLKTLLWPVLHISTVNLEFNKILINHVRCTHIFRTRFWPVKASTFLCLIEILNCFHILFCKIIEIAMFRAMNFFRVSTKWFQL